MLDPRRIAPVGRLAAASRRPVFGVPLWQLVVGFAIAGSVVALAFSDRVLLRAGRAALAGADGEWLLIAAGATALIWVSGTVSQLGSVPVPLRAGRLLATQVAASFANNLLPAGSGGMAVNVRFLRRHGMSRTGAVGAVGLNSLAGLVAHLVLLAFAVWFTPTVLDSIGVEMKNVGLVHLGHAFRSRPWLVMLIVTLLVVGVLAFRRSGSAVTARLVQATRQIRTEFGTLWAVLRDPGRAAKLWLGSLSAPVLHGLILLAVLRALQVPLPVLTAIAVYVVASALSALLPSPGGLGALDVTLMAGLVAAGVPPAQSLGAILGYRLLTVWIPMLPGACMFAVLLRRRVI